MTHLLSKDEHSVSFVKVISHLLKKRWSYIIMDIVITEALQNIPVENLRYLQSNVNNN